MTDPTAPERAWQDIIGSEQCHSDSHNSIGSAREFGFALSRAILFCSVEDSQWIKMESGEWHAIAAQQRRDMRRRGRTNDSLPAKGHSPHSKTSAPEALPAADTVAAAVLQGLRAALTHLRVGVPFL